MFWVQRAFPNNKIASAQLHRINSAQGCCIRTNNSLVQFNFQVDIIVSMCTGLCLGGGFFVCVSMLVYTHTHNVITKFPFNCTHSSIGNRTTKLRYCRWFLYIYYIRIAIGERDCAFVCQCDGKKRVLFTYPDLSPAVVFILFTKLPRFYCLLRRVCVAEYFIV